MRILADIRKTFFLSSVFVFLLLVLNTETFLTLLWCGVLSVFFQKSYVEALTPSVMIFGDGMLER